MLLHRKADMRVRVCRKYRPGAWYAEFVFIYYKVLMSATSVLLDSDGKMLAGVGMMFVLTLGLLGFVMHVQPFDDGGTMNVRANKMQIVGLATTLCALACGALSMALGSSVDRKKADLAIDVVVTVMVVAPLLFIAGNNSWQKHLGQALLLQGRCF